MSSVTRLHFGIGLICCLGAATTGCGSDGPSSGALLVDWNIPIGCSATQVVAIEARAIPLDVLTTAEPVNVETVPCSNRAPVAFPALATGKYRVEVEGFNSEGVGTYFGVLPSISVRAGQQSETDPIPLQQKPGAIDVVWVFQNGKLCTHNGVDQVVVALFDEAAVQYMSTELGAPFPCDPGAEMPAESRIFGVNPDFDYQVQGLLLGSLPPQRTFFVHAVGYDATGEAVMKAERVVKTELGRVSEATLVFVPCWSEDAPNVACQ